MRLALVSGDGLPVSGLLTIFRNVVGLAPGLELPVTAELGYSWRPDKPGFFPRGPRDALYPEWLRVREDAPVGPDEWAAVRADVARADRLGPGERARLRQRIDALASPYEDYFARWFEEEDVDWVVAVNMTLSDAVPVTRALHRAAARRWPARRGGVLYWDHDLFGSCAVHEHGFRVYPLRPNEFTPLPGGSPADRWAVVSELQERETRTYPTPLRPVVLTNVLPAVPDGPLEARHREFLVLHGIAEDRPVVLVPVRVFAVKGVEIAIEVFAGLRARLGGSDPVLVVFGSLEEEPEYARAVERAVADHDVSDAIRFLGGVPISTDGARLDEIDLLRVARATGGAVLFTPSRPDVETVGLGPALAALADLPCAVTPYDAFAEHFGPDFAHVLVDPKDAHQAGAALADRMTALREGDESAIRDVKTNRSVVADRFPTAPWEAFLSTMNEALS